MKSGCLIKGFIASTIFFAVVFYIATNKMDDYIVKPIKSLSANYLTKNVKNEWAHVKASPEKDSLFSQIEYFTNNVKELKTVNLTAIGEVLDSINTFLDDSLVTKKDLENIKVMIEAELKHERSKKN